MSRHFLPQQPNQAQQGSSPPNPFSSPTRAVHPTGNDGSFSWPSTSGSVAAPVANPSSQHQLPPRNSPHQRTSPYGGGSPPRARHGSPNSMSSSSSSNSPPRGMRVGARGRVLREHSQGSAVSGFDSSTSSGGAVPNHHYPPQAPPPPPPSKKGSGDQTSSSSGEDAHSVFFGSKSQGGGSSAHRGGGSNIDGIAEDELNKTFRLRETMLVDGLPRRHPVFGYFMKSLFENEYLYFIADNVMSANFVAIAAAITDITYAFFDESSGYGWTRTVAAVNAIWLVLCSALITINHFFIMPKHPKQGAWRHMAIVAIAMGSIVTQYVRVFESEVAKAHYARQEHPEYTDTQIRGEALTVNYMYHGFLIVAFLHRQRTFILVGWMVTCLVACYTSLLFTTEAPPDTTRQLIARGVLDVLVMCASVITSLVFETYLRQYFIVFKQLLSSTKEIQQINRQMGIMLQMMLPATVIDRLGEGERKISDKVPEASVSFSDLVSFTKWCRKRHGADIVHAMNHITTAFDRAAIEFGVMKVKTVGDAYWVVCGLPDRQLDCAYRLCRFNIRQLEMIRLLNKRFPQWDNLEIRIGINTGPLAGGVVGTRQISYEVFGETSDSAEWLEQNAPVNTILASGTTKLAVERYLKAATEAAVAASKSMSGDEDSVAAASSTQPSPSTDQNSMQHSPVKPDETPLGDNGVKTKDTSPQNDLLMGSLSSSSTTFASMCNQSAAVELPVPDLPSRRKRQQQTTAVHIVPPPGAGSSSPPPKPSSHLPPLDLGNQPQLPHDIDVSFKPMPMSIDSHVPNPVDDTFMVVATNPGRDSAALSSWSAQAWAKRSGSGLGGGGGSPIPENKLLERHRTPTSPTTQLQNAKDRFVEGLVEELQVIDLDEEWDWELPEMSEERQGRILGNLGFEAGHANNKNGEGSSATETDSDSRENVIVSAKRANAAAQHQRPLPLNTSDRDTPSSSQKEEFTPTPHSPVDGEGYSTPNALVVVVASSPPDSQAAKQEPTTNAPPAAPAQQAKQLPQQDSLDRKLARIRNMSAIKCGSFFHTQRQEDAFFEYTNNDKRHLRTGTCTTMAGFTVAWFFGVMVEFSHFDNFVDVIMPLAILVVTGVSFTILALLSSRYYFSRSQTAIQYAVTWFLQLMFHMSVYLLPKGSLMRASLFTLMNLTETTLFISSPSEVHLSIHITKMAIAGMFALFDEVENQTLIFYIALVASFSACHAFIRRPLDVQRYLQSVIANQAAFEARRADELMRSVLESSAPPPMIDKMINIMMHVRVQDRGFVTSLNNVTVCFCRIVTHHADGTDGIGIWEAVNHAYVRIEQLLTKYPRAVKIKTVGSSLVVAGPLHHNSTKQDQIQAAYQISKFAISVIGHRSKPSSQQQHLNTSNNSGGTPSATTSPTTRSPTSKTPLTALTLASKGAPQPPIRPSLNMNRETLERRKDGASGPVQQQGVQNQQPGRTASGRMFHSVASRAPMTIEGVPLPPLPSPRHRPSQQSSIATTQEQEEEQAFQRRPTLLGAGLPQSRSDSPTKDAVVGTELPHHHHQPEPAAPVAIRSGVHTGPLTAAILGTSHMTYDIFGETVNTASRCSTTARQSTAQLSLDTVDFCEREGGKKISQFGREEARYIKGVGATRVLVC